VPQSPLHELNPFLDHNVDPSGPIVPGWFRLVIPAMILKESFIEHQANSNSQLPIM